MAGALSSDIHRDIDYSYACNWTLVLHQKLLSEKKNTEFCLTKSLKKIFFFLLNSQWWPPWVIFSSPNIFVANLWWKFHSSITAHVLWLTILLWMFWRILPVYLHFYLMITGLNFFFVRAITACHLSRCGICLQIITLTLPLTAWKRGNISWKKPIYKIIKREKTFNEYKTAKNMTIKFYFQKWKK